jgi:hypothetical protein
MAIAVVTGTSTGMDWPPQPHWRERATPRASALSLSRIGQLTGNQNALDQDL